MLQAINHNKSGINFLSKKGINQKFKPSEDSLTSSIIGLLLYLPVELQWKILRESIDSTITPQSCGSIISFDFWPRWKRKDSENTIEPDVYIQYENFDLIVEAKRSDSNQQSITQWQKQVDSYCFQNDCTKNKIYLLALGTNNTSHEIVTVTDDTIKVPILKCRWSYLLQSVIYNLKIIKKSKGILNSVSSSVNILEDLLLAFRIHGFSTGLWLNDINIDLYTINNCSRSYSILLKEYD